jgi:hypothetical protein
MEIDRKETPEELNRKIRRRISCIKSKFKGITQQDRCKIKIYLDKKEIAANTPPESEEKILDREKRRLYSTRRYFINKKGGTSDEWDDRFEPRTLSKKDVF